jgi:orotate phosphoribosyltransferase
MNERERLSAIIREKSFGEGEKRMLASGRTSNFYFDMKRTMADPEGASLVGRFMVAQLAAEEETIDFVGGLAMGAVPVSLAFSLEAYARGAPIPSFWIRPKPKEHGTQASIEGIDPLALQGCRALIVEDVTTSGGSALQAVARVREAGGLVDIVMTVVDREEGAGEALAQEGLRLIPLFTATDFRTA